MQRTNAAAGQGPGRKNTNRRSRRGAVSILLAVLVWAHGPGAAARTFYLDSHGGDDARSGLAPDQAWRSLDKAGKAGLAAGDALLLKRGGRFAGSLQLTVAGTPELPIEIAAYGEGDAPLIDAAGCLAGVRLTGSRNVAVRDLAITADGGKTTDGSNPARRYGVLVQAGKLPTANVLLERLTIYRIFPEKDTAHEGRNPTTFTGTAIAIEGLNDGSCTNFTVRGCRIAQTGHMAISLQRLRQVQVLDNLMKDIGGPAIQPGNTDDMVVRGNTVDGSGSFIDPRMHGRGSGIWPWTCNRVLIENNKFMHARGTGDSCGVHIDFNCSDVVVQYNLSVDNEGGFVEILGNNRNCAYRYNISINDGARIKGENGAFQTGKILWTSGYAGNDKPRSGPFDAYIYNNTVFVGPGGPACFSVAPSTDGLLIANNIFYFSGSPKLVPGDQECFLIKGIGSIPRALVANNLFAQSTGFPPGLPVKEEGSLYGNPQFSNPGGMDAADYIPRNTELVANRGMAITALPGDARGLLGGLAVSEDFFGNPIIGLPDLGAIETGR